MTTEKPYEFHGLSWSVHDPVSGYIADLSFPASITFTTKDAAPITDRDFEQYSAAARKKMVYDPSLQYLEVGAGLGGFMSHLLQHCRPDTRPIVIDPVDYEKMLDMLEFAQWNGNEKNPYLLWAQHLLS